MILVSFFLSFLVSIHGWFSGKASKPIADIYNRTLKRELESEKQANDEILAQEKRRLNDLIDEESWKLDEKRDELEKRSAYLEDIKRAFSASLAGGRKWLAQFIAEADQALDESIVSNMRIRRRPALKSSEEVAEARSERRKFKERTKFLEYQLKSYKEYFPFLEEYEEILLDEVIPLSPSGDNLEVIEGVDPVRKYLSIEDFNNLTPSERNQLALDRYLSGNLSQAAIGRLYERFLGYQYEIEGWTVDYHGIVEGYEDLGRDLICKKDGRVVIVQAKCWAAEKLIHEKHIFQLFGTTQLYLMKSQEQGLFPANVNAVLVTTTSLSHVAHQAADWLKIKVRPNFPLDKTYPMIKCNINQSTQERIYHLPFDQQYDRTKIIPKLNELYVRTTAEAESMGFRRAFRHMAR